MKNKLFIISAPSGAGKTTLVTSVIKEVSSITPIQRVVTYTTKEPRHTESSSDYNFLSIEEFEQRIEENYFLEWSCAYQNYYGSPRYILNKLHESSFILIVDWKGGESLKKVLSPDISVFIWIQVDDLIVLQERLLKRGTESQEQIKKRIEISLKEVEQEKLTPVFSHYIYNVDFDIALQDLKKLIFSSLNIKK
ncbi:hypothetical protein A3F66_06775 [candidate division TM6 bacterium RIFCSPHIGHO2_12_FULL_32_22]|nr:MAG: hypothetical protein A3F66_06775 [candidate division TM6 bacterium RIFCSPHIGHO2_12_FULL_32_22]